MYHAPMTQAPLDDEKRWRIALAKDRRFDGAFVTGVHSTGIYCRPSCPARPPRRENVRFYATPAEAEAAGLRACLRCKPNEVSRDRVAIDKALALLDASESAPSLTDLAEAVGYAPHHFQRLFTRDVGISPAAYARALRAKRLGEALDGEGRITDAIYDAGYEAPSRAYADARERFGMSPSAWRNGGAGGVIRFAVAAGSMGRLRVGGTDKGLCRISFDEDEAALRARFPKATIDVGDSDFAELVDRVVALVDDPARSVDLPIDVAGTAFQQAVWAALRAIPPGETRSYKELAIAAGKPGAVRAAGTACGCNNLAILIPCHRVVRSDGHPGGYAYGTPRKEALLRRESGNSKPVG